MNQEIEWDGDVLIIAEDGCSELRRALIDRQLKVWETEYGRVQKLLNELNFRIVLGAQCGEEKLKSIIRRYRHSIWIVISNTTHKQVPAQNNEVDFILRKTGKVEDVVERVMEILNMHERAYKVTYKNIGNESDDTKDRKQVKKVQPKKKKRTHSSLKSQKQKRVKQLIVFPQPTTPIITDSKIQINEITFHAKSNIVQQSDGRVKISTIENKLLEYLMCRPDTVVSFEELLDQVWNRTFDEMRVFKKAASVALAQLRKKLGWTKKSPIITVRGVGYQFVHKDNPASAPSVKRKETMPNTQVKSTRAMCDNIRLDVRKDKVIKDGNAIYGVTRREVEVLKYLIRRQGEIVTREEFLKDVWNISQQDRHKYRYLVDVQVNRLRKSIGITREYPIITIRGKGYMFIPAKEVKE